LLVRVALVAFALVLAFTWARSARAEPADFAKALRTLAQPSDDAVLQAVLALGATSDPGALRILQGLRDGDVRIGEDGGVYLRGEDGAFRDVASGRASTSDTLRAPRIDNTVRRALGPAIARRAIVAPEPEVRVAAAEELARRGSDDDVRALRDALANEGDGAVKRAITASLAELDLASDDPERRLTAVAAIERAESPALRAKLETLLGREPDSRVRAAATTALRALERKQFFVDSAANVLYGVSMGSILLLAALGLAITFGLMGVINMAHGEMLMLGAYATYATQLFFRRHFPEHLSLYLVFAIPAAFAVCMAIGAALERTVIRFLYGRPLETLLATWGLSLVLIQTVRLAFGAQNVTVENPSWLSGGVEIFDGVVLPYSRIAVVVFSAVVTVFVALVLQRTSFGLRVRAVTQNRAMAACMGISTARVDTWTFALGSGVGGLGGVALSQLGNVGPELGQGCIVDSFLVVVLGGVGKLAGCVISAFGLGVVNKLLEPVAGAVLGKIAVLLAVVLVIQKRPQGLFALRDRNAEA
jgi:urea transport system permease protein